MGNLARLVILVGICSAAPARADQEDDLVAQGEALAKQSDFSKAIELFKQADALGPRASNACLIGLVYTRRELWPQAELFFALCHARATPSDPLPPWIDKAEQQLAAKLAETGAAPVTIRVNPLEAKPSISVSSFAPDESFPPRTIHLARGRHVLEISAPGYVSTSREVVIDTSDPRTVVVELQTPQQVAAAEAAARARTEGHEPPPRSKVPLIIGLGGIALGLAGGAVDVFLVRPKYDALTTAPDGAVFASETGAYKTDRDLAVALYAAGGAVLVTAIVLRLTVYEHVEMPVRVSGAFDRGGGIVSVGWSR